MKVTRLNLAWGTNELPELKPHWDKWLSKAQERDIFSPSGFFGHEELQAAIAQRFQERYQSEINPRQVTVTNGGTEALYTIFQWVKERKGQVILQQPAWGYFEEALQLLGIPIQHVTTTEADQLKLQLSEIASDIPTLFLLTQPSNPLGKTFDLPYLKELSRWVQSSDQNYVLSDEIYDWFATSDDDFHSWSEVQGFENSFIVHGYSKPTGLAAWRVGYFIAPIELSRQLNQYHKNATYGTASISQFMALEAQKEEGEIRKLLQHAIQKRRKIINEHWQHLDGVELLNDSVGMYSYVTLPWDKNRQNRFFHSLMEEGELMITPGYDFRIENGGMRLNIARPIADLEEAIEVIQSQLKSFTNKAK